MTIHFSGTSTEPGLPEPVQARLICHLLLNQIPERGLAEALESLLEILRFHREPVPRMMESAPPESIPATLGAMYDRPPFHVTED
jgi:hypothetical protein